MNVASCDKFVSVATLFNCFSRGSSHLCRDISFNVATQLMSSGLLLCRDISCNVATQLMPSSLLTKVGSKEGCDTSTYVAT